MPACLPTSPPGCLHTSPSLIDTQTPLFLCHTRSLKYFKQHTFHFLFLKLSCKSSGIPDDPGGCQDKLTQSVSALGLVRWLWGYPGGSGAPCVTPRLYTS